MKDEKLTVNQALEIHRVFSWHSPLRDLFCDGFLYQENKLYRNIRDAAVAHGISFVDTDFCDYFRLPLFALPEILQRGAIPYLKSANLVEKVAPRTGELPMQGLPSFPKSHLLHESAHCIASHVLSKMEKGQNEKVLAVLMAESFANTCETVASHYCETPVHLTLYSLNSYLPTKHESVDWCMHRFGFSVTFKLIFLAFLLSNFLSQKVHPKIFSLIVQLTVPEYQTVTKAELTKIREMQKIAFGLSLGFRSITSRFFMRYIGFDQKLEELLDFNFLALLFKNSEYVEMLEQLVSAARGEETQLIKMVA